MYDGAGIGSRRDCTLRRRNLIDYSSSDALHCRPAMADADVLVSAYILAAVEIFAKQDDQSGI